MSMLPIFRAGLHMGHPIGYTAVAILLHGIKNGRLQCSASYGWDAFGLPAEQYAVKKKLHPRIQTEANIKSFRKATRSSAWIKI